MFRTLIISKGEWIGIEDNWIIVSDDKDKNRIPLEDVYSVIIDNQCASISTNAITRMLQHNIHVMICNQYHLPEALLLPLNTHYRPLNVLKKQLVMSQDFKDNLWQKIIRAKISNQVFVLKNSFAEGSVIARMEQFIKEVLPGDPINCEGLSAKMFFRSLYGSDFIRMADDAINASLNYGYSIIRSAVARSLNAYGYNCLIGIHHINEANAFNLADDLMEPLRPLVDLWVDDNHMNLINELSMEQRKELVNLVNWNVNYNNCIMKLRYALDKYVSSMTTAIEKDNPDLLIVPQLIKQIDD